MQWLRRKRLDFTGHGVLTRGTSHLALIGIFSLLVLISGTIIWLFMHGTLGRMLALVGTWYGKIPWTLSALAGIGLAFILVLWKLPVRQARLSKGVTYENRFDRENEARKTLAQILGGIVVLAGIYFSLENLKTTQENLRTAQEGQVTERFTKAIEQLGATSAQGKKRLELRLGAIYALQRIAKDSPKDRQQIIEILSAYVRINAKKTKEPNYQRIGSCGEVVLFKKPDPDIQAILTFFSTRPEPYKDADVDLTGVNLVGANMSGPNLQWAVFEQSDLREVAFDGSDLTNASLGISDLRGALLAGTNLSSASLHFSDLRGADLQDAILKGADLSLVDLRGNECLEGADFTDAAFDETSLEGADLSKAKGLTQSQIEHSWTDKSTKFPSYLKAVIRSKPKQKSVRH